ncbi:hypothetical protein H5410_047860 [Solanum commersonii]|uniref:Uncharacterized protein n=1 Tax=Solanum commersonii TaxID=4109 RepID=A0A9J5XIC2_SOLCO|nr:hypothetical protein H5410_047860 [Solanum commersonii]
MSSPYRMNTFEYTYIKKGIFLSSLRKVENHILASQTVADLEGEHLPLKKLPNINWLFRALSEESEAEDAIKFRKNIHAYNSIFAFTSFGVNMDMEIASVGKTLYTFRTQDQIYHDLPSLVSRDNNPCYFQLYFFDTYNELTNKISKV